MAGADPRWLNHRKWEGDVPDKKPATSSNSRPATDPAASAFIDPKTVITSIQGGRSGRRLAAQRVVFSQGDAADAVFYVRSGRVQVTVVSNHGKRGIIALFGPGEFFGEGCLAGETVRLASAVATTASEIVRIDKASMIRLLHEQPDFSEKFMAFLVGRNIQVEADLVDQLFNSSEKRLARLLLRLANFNNDDEVHPIVPKISQEVLAACIGTTRPRVSYFLNKFRNLGLIEYNSEIKVHPALLSVIRDG